jgi:Mitochondrial carrier protein
MAPVSRDVNAAGSPLTITDHFLCGAGAGLAGSWVACPTELIKCRLQARSGAMPQVILDLLDHGAS